MKKYKVGVIGNGFVGRNIAYTFSSSEEVFIYDLDPSKSTHNLDVVLDSNFVFVCVPTPMNIDGSQSLKFIQDVFKKAKPGPIYIIKSTVIPGTSKILESKYPDLNIIFSPEFLSERTAKVDSITDLRFILGGKQNLVDEVEKLYNSRFKSKFILKTDSTSAELIKYMLNTFYATKISFVNEFKRLSESLEANFDDVLSGFASDSRISDYALDVPGPDGKLGYGGTCFPKDVNAIIEIGKLNNIPLNTVEGGWKTNLEIRPEKDWEQDKGRVIL